MRKTFLLLFSLCCILSYAANRSWDFTNWSTETLENLTSDVTNWDPTTQTRFANLTTIASGSVVQAAGNPIKELEGITFNSLGKDKIRVDYGSEEDASRLILNGKDLDIYISDCSAGDIITVVTKTASGTDPNRTVTPTNAVRIEGETSSYDKVIGKFEVTANGRVTFRTTGGLQVFSISVEEPVYDAPVISLQAGENEQSVYVNQAISPIVYKWGGPASTTATVEWSQGLPNGISVDLDNEDNKVTISGTPTTGGEYSFTVYSSAGEEKSEGLEGKITVRETDKYKLAYVTAIVDGEADPRDQLLFTDELKELFDINIIDATKTNVDYSIYDVVALSAVPASSAAGVVAGQTLHAASFTKPFVQMKTFMVQSNRWAWLNQNPQNTKIQSIELTEKGKTHALFKNVTFEEDETILLAEGDGSENAAVYYQEWHSNVNPTPITLATPMGMEQGSYAEIPVGTQLGATPEQVNQYPILLLGLSEGSWYDQTDNAKTIVLNALKYVVGHEDEVEDYKAEIISFKLNIERESEAVITAPTDSENGKIEITLPSGTDVTNLSPTIQLSAGAMVTPESGQAQDFTNMVTYTVTSQDGLTIAKYDVIVTLSIIANDEANLLTLKVNGVEAAINQDNTSAAVTLPKNAGPLGIYSVEYTVSEAATSDIVDNKLDLTSGTATIKVTAEDGTTTKEYTVTATISGNMLIAYVTDSGTVGEGNTEAASDKDARDTKIYPVIAEYGDVELIAANSYNSSDYSETEIKEMFADYDFVYVSESVDGKNKLGINLKYLVGYKPFLSTKTYFYSSGRWGWATPTDGNVSSGEPVEYAITINEDYKKHPLFEDITLDGLNLQVFESDLRLLSNYHKGVQGFNTSTLSAGGELIASPIGTPAATAIHEINTEATAKYLLVAYCSDNFDKLTDAGVQLIKNAVDYLLSNDVFIPNSDNVNSESNSSLKAYVKDGILYLSGLADGSTVEVYTIGGQKQQSIKAAGNDVNIPISQLSIVRIVSEKGVEVIKVLNK